MAYELRNSQPDPVVADEDSEELEYDVGKPPMYLFINKDMKQVVILTL
jgi:hypothetical protein